MSDHWLHPIPKFYRKTSLSRSNGPTNEVIVLSRGAKFSRELFLNIEFLSRRIDNLRVKFRSLGSDATAFHVGLASFLNEYRIRRDIVSAVGMVTREKLWDELSGCSFVLETYPHGSALSALDALCCRRLPVLITSELRPLTYAQQLLQYFCVDARVLNPYDFDTSKISQLHESVNWDLVNEKIHIASDEVSFTDEFLNLVQRV